MTSLIRNIILITMLLMFSPVNANTDDETVSSWLSQTLLKTLAINYEQQPGDFNDLKKNYSLNAWDGMVQFFSRYKATVKDKQLTLHPVLVGVPNIVKSGLYSGIQYWYIEQSVIIYEFKVKIDFAFLVLARNPATDYPYVIQSLNMKLTPLSD